MSDTARFSISCDTEERAMIVQAALAEDRSVSQYIIRAAVAAARDTIAQAERVQ